MLCRALPREAQTGSSVDFSGLDIHVAIVNRSGMIQIFCCKFIFAFDCVCFLPNHYLLKISPNHMLLSQFSNSSLSTVCQLISSGDVQDLPSLAGVCCTLQIVLSCFLTLYLSSSFLRLLIQDNNNSFESTSFLIPLCPIRSTFDQMARRQILFMPAASSGYSQRQIIL